MADWAEGLHKAVEITERVFDLEVGEDVAIGRSLDSARVTDLGLDRQRAQSVQGSPRREIPQPFAYQQFAAQMGEALVGDLSSPSRNDNEGTDRKLQLVCKRYVGRLSKVYR